MSDETRSTPWINNLLHAHCFPHRVDFLQLRQTHISWVILTGIQAYKIKKPVNLGFLDFSTLALRHHFCQEELRLNRRLAPELYRDILPVCGTPQQPYIGPCRQGDTPIDYAVHMIQFDPEQCLDRLPGPLSPTLIIQLASTLAQFHETAAVAGNESPYGQADLVLQPMIENFQQLQSLVSAQSDTQERLHTWTLAQYQKLRELLQQRWQQGCVRECHGDLHLGNIVLWKDRALPFDCLEFNPDLRWIDTVSENAFLCMDLEQRGYRDLAWLYLNEYLEQRDDYTGLALLRFYQVYRAIVRAKVAAIRAHQLDINSKEKQQALDQMEGYLEMATAYSQPTNPCLILTHGLSGSGKSTWSSALMQRLPAIRLRSDVIRKRLHNLPREARTAQGLGKGIYNQAAGEITYQTLLSHARNLISAGITVIVDATFLSEEQRRPFTALAQQLKRPCHILDFQAGEECLRKRVMQRAQQDNTVSEAGIAVLERQLKNCEALTEREQIITLAIDSETENPTGARLEKLVNALRSA